MKPREAEYSQLPNRFLLGIRNQLAQEPLAFPGAAGFQQLTHIPELLLQGATRLPIPQFNRILRRGVGRQQNGGEEHPKPSAQHKFIE